MSNVFEGLYRRIFGPTYPVIASQSSNSIQTEKRLQKEKYITWIHKQFLLHNLNLINEIDLLRKLNGKKISHWVPFLFCQKSISLSEQLLYSWSDINKSININILEDDPFTFHRNPVACSTDSIRCKVGFSEGIHIWKIKWPESMRGTHAVIGVSTNQSRLQYDSYVSLVGLDSESWGWDIANKVKVHNLQSGNLDSSQKYPDPSKLRNKVTREKFHRVPETIYVVLDMYQGTLSFMASNIFLGIAHTGLSGKTVYPTVSSVWGHSEISMQYIHYITKTPPTLKSMCLYQVKRLFKLHCQFNDALGKVSRYQLNYDIHPAKDFREIVMSRNIPKHLKILLLNRQFSFLKF